MKLIPIALALTAITMCSAFDGQHEKKWVPTKKWLETSRYIYVRPSQGYVKDKKTAMVIGKAIIAGVYGEDWVKGTGPYDAVLIDNIWVVYSYFPTEPVLAGGATSVQIDRTTGTILQVVSER